MRKLQWPEGSTSVIILGLRAGDEPTVTYGVATKHSKFFREGLLSLAQRLTHDAMNDYMRLTRACGVELQSEIRPMWRSEMMRQPEEPEEPHQ